VTKRIHPVSSFLTPKRDLRVSARRDLGAALDILPTLMKLGYEYGEPILDWPPEAQAVNRYSEPLFQTNNSFVQPGDLLLQTTRPPLDDDEQNDRKRVRRSFTDLEDHLFKLWGNYLERSARSHIFLHQRFHRSLAPGFENRRQMKFREAEGAPYLSLNDCTGSGFRRTEEEEKKRRTAAFLLRCDAAWAGGPGLVSAFGMDGTVTAVWGYRLGRDYSDLLKTPGFVVAELVNTGIPKRPTSMVWASDWEIRIMLHEKWA
jgi:hypothetical protein